jgi:uncharacterized protein YjiS (DUF1127 family)
MRINSLLSAFAAYWQAAQVRHVAIRELAAMSACELGDMGITPLDASRLFEPRLMPEFQSRGGGGRASTATTFKPRPQRSAVMTSLGSPA